MPTEAAPAKVPYRSVARTGLDTDDQLPYTFIDWVTANHLPDLVDVRIGVAWHNNLKPDTDGRVELGSCRLIGDPMRQQCGLDVNLTLNQEWWYHAATTDEMRKAYIHHLLMHIGVRKADDGEIKKDELSRPRLYTRKHNIEEFREVISVHGMYVDDLSEAYAVMRQAELERPEPEVPAEPAQAGTV